ncbi:HupE/UreJ family protein [Agromyces ramosus]|uniref:Hydrogenase/urease accessory protein HupE n=1 Tax=Agromyces ramosus TaxID=33879 RepID=A0ABU0R8X5_9MICO|nr:HupE/UreJ family protein [Agromyces ramosus]MDQ0894518.1 hydrogenase/urease accessory protein HupE [Agromyces ramosus]
MPSRPGIRRLIVAVAIAIAATASAMLPSLSAAAHGFSTVVYVDASAPSDDTVRTELGLEYDLLVVSVADQEDAPQFFEDGMDVFQTGDEASALNAHADEIVQYVTERFAVSAGGRPCEPTPVGEIGVTQRKGVPYAVLTLDHSCAGSSAHEIRSELFPDSEEYVTGTVTVVEYDLDGASGSAALDRDAPVFTTEQPLLERFGHFFVLGAEHLLFGIDHILFLLALIVGSRRLRDVVLAATSFTVAHSVTFILAALGIVSAPAAIVEPIIALSIAVVAMWYLWRIRHDRRTHEPERPGRFGLTRADWGRLAVVFGFGLMHGLGFAGAFGIDEPFSWQLLSSLLVFNVGIEAVQIAIIAAVFPLLALLRRREPMLALGVGGLVAAGVAVTGLVWFVQRVLGV